MKALTVIVPAYDMADWLPRALASLEPPPPSLEVIVVNDGSRDGTSAIAHDWATRHPGTCRVIDKPNGHYGSCVNAGLAAATGRYARILDADDVFNPEFLPDYLSFVSAAASEPSPPDVLVNDVEWLAPDGHPVRQVRHGLPYDFGMDALLARADAISMHALAYRTDLLRDIGYRQTEGIMYTDTEWYTLPMAVARSGRAFPFPLYRYQTGRPGQSVDAKVYAANVAMLLRVFESLASACRRPAPEVNLAYMRAQLIRLGRLIACICFFNVPRRQVTADLAPFLAGLEKEWPEVLEAIDSMCVFTWSPWPVRHLRLWRRHPALRGPLVAVLRLYESLVRHFRTR